MQRPDRNLDSDRTPRGLRETPLIVLGLVAAFVILAIVLAGVLLREEEPEPDSGGAGSRSEPTATASPTPAEATVTATSAAGTGGVAPPTATTPPPPAETPAEPTVAPEPTTPPEPEPTSPPSEPDDTVSDALLDLLPALDTLPDGFVVTSEGIPTLDEVAEVHPDPAMQAERLRDWGFTGAAERQFERETPADDASAGMRLLAVLVVEFASPEDARAAVDAAHADAQAAENTEIASVEIEPLGDFSLAASGTLTIEGETLQVAYVMVQVGNRAFTFGGGSPTGDPLSEVVGIAEDTVNLLAE